MQKKGLLLLCGMLAASILLSGCTAGSPSANANSSGSLASSTGANAPKDTEKMQELNFYYPVAAGGPIATIMDGLCAEFTQENPNIKVNPIYTGSYADTRTKIQSDMQAGTLPEVAIMFSTDLFSLLDMNAIVDVDSFLKTSEDQAFIEDFYEGFMLNTQTGGKTWGVPFQRSTIVLYYNKDAFQEAGLDPEAPPATWDDMLDYAKALNKEGRWGIEIPATGYAYWMLQTFTLQQNGKNLMNGEGNEVYFDSAEAKQGLNYWYSLSSEHKVMPAGTIEWASTPTDFIEGKTAMMYHTTGNLTNVKNNAKFDFGVAMLPAKETRGSPTGGGNFYIFQTDEARQQAAWEFVRWMTGPENIAQWSIDTGYVAPRKSAYETEAMKTYTKDFPYALVARDQLEFAAAELSTHENGRVTKVIEDAVQSVLTGTATVDDALAGAQKDATSILSAFQ